jgi:hypothetical protein
MTMQLGQLTSTVLALRARKRALDRDDVIALLVLPHAQHNEMGDIQGEGNHVPRLVFV